MFGSGTTNASLISKRVPPPTLSNVERPAIALDEFVNNRKSCPAPIISRCVPSLEHLLTLASRDTWAVVSNVESVVQRANTDGHVLAAVDNRVAQEVLQQWAERLD